MITWVTVWVLVISFDSDSYHRNNNLKSYYQLQYQSKELCEKQKKIITRNNSYSATCNFSQIPMVTK